MFYLLPGMGASKEMYQGVWLKLPGIKVINWPQYQGEISISEVAERLIQKYRITSNDWIGGSSFGGMVAVEIYKKLKNKKVVLLGSALQVEEINILLRCLAPFISAIPIKSIQWLVKKYDHKVLRMFHQAEAAFIKAMCRAVLKWDGYVGESDSILRIHGEQDRMIKCPKQTKIVKGAGHLVAMTHPEECIQIINTVIE